MPQMLCPSRCDQRVHGWDADRNAETKGGETIERKPKQPAPTRSSRAWVTAAAAGAGDEAQPAVAGTAETVTGQTQSIKCRICDTLLVGWLGWGLLMQEQFVLGLI